MWRYVWLMLGFMLMFSLAACGSAPSNEGSSTTNVAPVSGTSDDGAAATAQRMIDALAAQDTTTVMALADANMPMRDLALGGELQAWKDRTVIPESYYYKSIGPLVRTELQPAEQRGATTAIKAILHHQLGDAEITVDLHETADGWRVVGLDSRVTDHPAPTPKR